VGQGRDLLYSSLHDPLLPSPPTFVNLSAAIRGSPSEFPFSSTLFDWIPLPSTSESRWRNSFVMRCWRMPPGDLTAAKPLTGSGRRRDGRCRTDSSDLGQHTVCLRGSRKVSSYSRSQGNDLKHTEHGIWASAFKPGDHWSSACSRCGRPSSRIGRTRYLV